MVVCQGYTNWFRFIFTGEVTMLLVPNTQFMAQDSGWRLRRSGFRHSIPAAFDCIHSDSPTATCNTVYIVPYGHTSGSNATINRRARLFNFLPSSYGEFYRYTGSLTTPPCYESVLWTVFTDFIPISDNQMAEFRNLTYIHSDGNTKPIEDNFRPIQDLKGREVYINFEKKAQKMKCPSRKGKSKLCPTKPSLWITDVNVLEQKSKKPCTKGITFFAFGTYVAVTNGCSGVFQVVFD
ncbi:hypothetical protein ScPMuIL_015292 [Solemya velum]